MKVANRRKRILIVYAAILLGVFACGVGAQADELTPQSEPPETNKNSQPTSPALESARQIPVTRELSAEDYQWLGQEVWQTLQEKVPAEQRRGLNSHEIHALVEMMRKNREEFNVQLGDLMRILSTRAKAKQRDGAPEEGASPKLCPKEERAPSFGFDLGRIKPPQY